MRDLGAVGQAHRQKLSPPEIARRWGISPEKVVAWIRAGELRAIDVATKRGGRPRYLINVADLAAFEVSRTVVAQVCSTKRRHKKPDSVIEFF